MAKKKCIDHKGNVFNSLNEMCAYYGVPYSAYYTRLKEGWTLKDALETPAVDVQWGKCKDHLGNEFESVVEMCNHWGIPYARFLNRLNNLKWSLKDSLERPKQFEGAGRSCRDHNGKQFRSITEMCKYYNIEVGTLNGRLKLNWSLKDALETPVGETIGRKCTDHKGNVFSSETEMCKYYNIKLDTFKSRIKHGMSLQDSLETPLVSISDDACIDHCGRKFSSIKEMASYWGVTEAAFYGRRKLGWSLKDILETPVGNVAKKCKDHKGNEFKSISAMCRYYNIGLGTYNRRVASNWSLKDILETPETDDRARMCKDHKGNEFKSISDMCRYYGVTTKVFSSRLRAGWSLKDALETPVANNVQKCKDHVGNEFDSFAEMCRHWGMSTSTVRRRLEQGVSLEMALKQATGYKAHKGMSLEMALKQDTGYKDHRGNTFKSISDMCRHYGVEMQTFKSRIKAGRSLKDALETPTKVNSKRCTDHLGNTFDSMVDMCKYWGVNYTTFKTRIHKGWSLQMALEAPPSNKV